MDYLPVRLSTLKADTLVKFDIYIKLPRRYILYVRKDGEMASSQLLNLKSKKVRKLFIEAKDEPHYQDFLDQGLNAMAADKNIKADEKATMAKEIAGDTAEKVFANPDTQASYDAVCKTSKNLLKIISGSDDVLKEILSKECSVDGNPFVAKLQNHAVNASSLALRFGEFLGFKVSDLETLGIAAMYHDIGLTLLSKEAFEASFKELKSAPPALMLEYFRHPKKACELLQDKEFASKEVLDLILTHEERVDGSGFPAKLTKLTPLQEVHSLCCYYDRETTILGKAAPAVISALMVECVGKFNLPTINKFRTFIKKIMGV